MTRPRQDRFDRIEDLVDCGRTLPDIARALGIQEKSVERSIFRHGRADLLPRIRPRTRWVDAS